MTQLLSGRAPARTWPRPASFWLVGALLVALLLASSAPSPLYASFGHRFGFGTTMVTVVFGVYAVALLLALLVFGRLSDHLGRRPLLLAGIGLEAGSMFIFALAGGLPALLAARILQGLATGVATAAIGAALVQVRGRGAPVPELAVCPAGE